MYQDMMDDQLAIEMSQGKGLGLADMLIRQLEPRRDCSRRGKSIRRAAPTTSRRSRNSSRRCCRRPRSGRPRARRRSARHHCAGGARDRLGHLAARRCVGRQPQPVRHQGRRELEGRVGRVGAPRNTKRASRAPKSRASAPTGRAEASVNDYVSLLRDNPRYAAALNTGGDVRAFATALQRGGYATDPDYANKLVAVARQVAEQLGQRQASCRFPQGRSRGADKPARVVRKNHG